MRTPVCLSNQTDHRFLEHGPQAGGKAALRIGAVLQNQNDIRIHGADYQSAVKRPALHILAWRVDGTAAQQLDIIVLNIGALPAAVASIFAGAFTGAAPTGGFVGAALTATIKNGCARSMYSSDAGNGSSSYIHAQANTDDPVKQGCFGVFEVFFDTIIVCTFTALVILCTGVWTTADAGSVLAINAFSGALGTAGNLIASLGLLLFAGSTALSFCTFVGLCIDDMFHNKTLRYICQVIFVVIAFAGGTVGVDIILMWADFANALCITLNVAGMCNLTKILHNLTVSYFKTGRSSAN